MYMSQAQNRVWKRDERGLESPSFSVYLAWMHWQMCRPTMAVLLCMHSGFPTKLMKQTIVTSLGDIMGFSHVIE